MEDFLSAIICFLVLAWLVGMGFMAAGTILVPSLVITLGVAFLLFLVLLVRTCRASSLARVVSARWSDEEICWSVNHDEVVRWSQANWLAVICAVCGGLVAVGGFAGSERFQVLSPFRRGLGVILTIIVLVGTSILIGKLLRWFAVHRVKVAIESRKRQAMRCAGLLQTLRQMEGENKGLAAGMGVEWTYFSGAIGDYVAAHREDLLRDMGHLEHSVRTALDKARADHRELEDAAGEHAATMTAFRNASVAVNHTGGITFIKELEIIYEALESENMRGLLTGRKWDDYRAIQHEVIADLHRLKTAAEQYEGAAFAPEPPEGEMGASRAYKLLDAAPEMPLDEIKRNYRRKANAYHPDKAATTNDDLRDLAEEHFKEITLAWAYIEENHPRV